MIDVPDLEHTIGPRLWISDEAIAMWMTDELPSELVVEEVHTAAEATLRHLLSVGRGPTWPVLLRDARSAGYLTTQDEDVLNELSQHRNRLKHRGATVAADERDRLRAILFESIDWLDRRQPNHGG